MQDLPPSSKLPKSRLVRKKRARYNPFELDPYNPVRGEEALWRAVITQALMDAASNSHKPELIYQRNESRHWLLESSGDFCMVCHFAGLEPTYVRRMAKRALARNCKWRSEPGHGKRKKNKASAKPKPVVTDEHAPCQIIPLFARAASL